MKCRQFFLAAFLLLALAVSGSARAQDAAEHNKAGHDRWAHHGQCEMLRLPKEKRELYHETMKKVYEDNKDEFSEMHKLHKQLHNVLKAETFDADAFTSLSGQIEQVHNKIHKARTDALASIADQFTPKERVMIMHHHGCHHKHGHGGMRGKWDHDHEGMRDHSTDSWQMPQQQDDRAYPPYTTK